MNLRNFIRLGALAVVSAVGFSCTPDNKSGGGKKELNENLAFTLEVTEVEADKAKIKVEHNGERDDTWYGFATTESNIDGAVLDKIDELLEGKERISGLQKSTSKTVTVRDLEPETDYTFVAFGLTEDGTYYGIPETVEFTTTADYTNISKSDEWKISYQRGEYEGKAAELVTIECAEDSRYYFDYVTETYVTETEAGDLLDAYVSYLVNDEIPSYLDNYKITEFTYVGPGTFPLNRMGKGNYYAICIGYGEDGLPTGTYSAQKFTVVEEEATQEYTQWIGKYTMTAANGVSYDVNIAQYDNNYQYIMYGWETGDALDLDNNGDGYPDGMCFDNQFGENVVYFGVLFSDGKLHFNEQIISPISVLNENNQEVECYLGLYGYGKNGENLSIMLSQPFGATIATAEMTDAGATATVTGVSGENMDGTVMTYTNMGYAAVAQDYSDVFLWNQPAEFPITMTRLNDAAAQQSIGTLRLESKRFNRESALENIMLKNPRMTMKIAR